MQRFCDEHPELAAMFQALQDGIEGRYNSSRKVVSVGHALKVNAKGDTQALAAGLRMVADAIDPPPTVEAKREIAETLGPSMLTPDEWEARLTARNRERDKLNQLGPQCPPPHTRG